MAEEGIVVPGEQEKGSQNPAEAHQIAVEAKARQQGWKPLDDPDYKGDPADWVDAKEFVGRRPLFDTIHDLKRQLNKQEQRNSQDMQVIQRQFATMQEAAYRKALDELQYARDQAIANADVEVVRKLDQQIDQEKIAHVKAISVPQTQQNVEPTPYMVEWRKSNPWYDTDPELQDEALSIGIGYATKNQGVSQEKILTYITDRIKKIYPEKFQTSKSKERTDVEETTSKVEGGGTRLGGNSKKGKLTVADLNDDEKKVLSTLKKTHALKYLAEKNKRSEEEEYLAQIGALSQT